jgi:hypothetical protein
MRVYFSVRECSSFSDKARQILRQMEEVAWDLIARGPKRQAGFGSPGDMQGNEPDIELVLDNEA